LKVGRETLEAGLAVWSIEAERDLPGFLLRVQTGDWALWEWT